MEIRIVVTKRDPPAGEVRNGQAEPIAFSGWLELLAVLERLCA